MSKDKCISIADVTLVIIAIVLLLAMAAWLVVLPVVGLLYLAGYLT